MLSLPWTLETSKHLCMDRCNGEPSWSTSGSCKTKLNVKTEVQSAVPVKKEVQSAVPVTEEVRSEVGVKKEVQNDVQSAVRVKQERKVKKEVKSEAEAERTQRRLNAKRGVKLTSR